MSCSLRGFSWNSESLRPEADIVITLDAESVTTIFEKIPRGHGEEVDELDSSTAGVITRLSNKVQSYLHEGPGMAIVSADGLERLTDYQLRYLLYRISVMLGSPMAQNSAGDLIVPVRDEAQQDASARGYRTKEHLPMHTDAADATGLMCLRQGATGGINSFVSAETVHDMLCDEQPDLVPEFYRRWDWDRRGLEPSGESPVLTSSIFSYYHGYLSCRYAPKLLRGGPARAGRSLNPAQAKALDCFEEVAARPALKVSWCLSRGESVWINNYAVLHAREAFTNGVQPTSERHLLRTWVWTREGRPLAPAFASPRNVY